MGIAVSGGFLVKQIRKAGKSLQETHTRLMEAPREAEHPRIDESG
jgi:hypothetical protein